MFSINSPNKKDFVRLLLYIFQLPTFWVAASTVPLEYGELKLFQTPVTYNLNTSVSINDENEGNRAIGYRITAIVGVETIWSDQKTDFLLKFHLESPKLYIVGKKGAAPARSPWDSLAPSSFFVRLQHGAVQAAYLDERDPLDLLNYKKSIVSLFQFRAIDGENKETDISGLCDVVYQSTSLTTIHKIKTRCADDSPQSWSRRATYSLSPGLDALAGARAREHVRLRVAHVALAAHAEHALELRGAASSSARPGRDLDRALHSIPAHLKPQALTLQAEPSPKKWEWEEEEELGAALAALVSLGDEEAAGAGGTAGGARAALRVLRALAGAGQAAVRAALSDERYHAVLPALYRLVGQSGSQLALAAAADRLQLGAADPPRALASQLLAGAAGAPQPQAGARAALLQLARSARAPHVAGAALLAAAAQARGAHDDAARELRDLITKQLAKCKDDPCRIVRLHALGNMRAHASADTMLEHAARGRVGAALAALDALGTLDALQPPLLAALQDIAAAGGRALEVRAGALALVLRRAPARLPALAAALRRAPHELRRVLWQLVEQLREDGHDVEQPLREVHLQDRGWHARANSGTSSILSRATGWQLDSGEARLSSTQIAAGGALRRGTVALNLHPQGEELLAVEVWTRGVESFAGGSEEELRLLDEGEDAAGALRGELRLRVGGVHQPGLLLFDGQAELLGHVWAGAGSAATPVLRGARARLPRTRTAPLLAGAVLTYRTGHVNTFAVDAQAQVSLWSRSARAMLELRAAAASSAQLGVAGPGGAALALAAAASSEPRLQLAAHLDFYDGVALCVRASLAPHGLAANSSWSQPGSRGGARAAVGRAGRTLALGAGNDRTCRHIAAEDHQ